MPMTTRVMPPADGLHPSIVANGRSYACALGSTLDVPDQDALIMLANGWTSHGSGGQVGATAARPVNPYRGQEFHDSTLGKTIVSDGKVWRDPASGASV